MKISDKGIVGAGNSFGTGGSAELGGVDGADAVWSVRRIQLVVTVSPHVTARWVSECPVSSLLWEDFPTLPTPCHAEKLLNKPLCIYGM